MNNNEDNQLRQEILTQSIWKLMAKFSLPAIIAMSINSLNTFVDALFIGQYVGQDALAAVSLAFPLTMITNGLAAMIGVGGSSLLSIAIGAGDKEVQKKMFGTLTVLTFISTGVLMFFGLMFSEELIAMMGGSGEILKMGAYYYEVMILGSFFRIYGVVLNNIIRAEGKMNQAMIFLIAATLLNIILNPIFIAYYGWGIAGAAWSTVVAMALLTVIGVIYYVRGHAGYEVDLKYWKVEKHMLKPILSVGVSAMMMQIMFFVQQIFVFRSIAHYGNDWHLAFMGACYRIKILMIMPVFGFSQALQPIAGINFGAGVYDRVKEGFKKFAIASTILLLSLWGFQLLFPGIILGWMLPDATFSAVDIFNFRVQMASYIVFPFFLMAITVFQSIGRARIAGIMLVARELMIFIPLVLLLPLWFGVNGIYYAVFPVNIVVFAVASYFLKKQFDKWAPSASLSQMPK
ncbi:MAG: putative MATE family efflux protein [Saprospiraceae bacterium]